jgi:hypothetical protein
VAARPGAVPWLPWRHAWSPALLGGIGNGFVVWAQQGLSSGIAALVISSIPVVVLLLNWAFFERQARSGALGHRLALAGVRSSSRCATASAAKRRPHVAHPDCNARVEYRRLPSCETPGAAPRRHERADARGRPLTGAMAIANREWTS